MKKKDDENRHAAQTARKLFRRVFEPSQPREARSSKRDGLKVIWDKTSGSDRDALLKAVAMLFNR